MKAEDDTDWIKCCTVMQVEGASQRRRPRKTWWNVVLERTGKFWSVPEGRTRVKKKIKRAAS